MAGNGPPPKDPDSRARRNAVVAMTMLPAAGRPGPAPRWPLSDDVRLRAGLSVMRTRQRQLLKEMDDCTDGRTRGKLNRELGRLQEQIALAQEQIKVLRRLELEIWGELWATPQAAQWELLGWHRDVATYVRHKVRGEMGDLAEAKEARMWSDRLGLNPTAMLRLRWQVQPAQVEAEKKTERLPASRELYGQQLRLVADPEAGAA